MTDSTELIAVISQRIAQQLLASGFSAYSAAYKRALFARVAAELQPFAEVLDAARELYNHTDVLAESCCLKARQDYIKALAKLRALAGKENEE